MTIHTLTQLASTRELQRFLRFATVGAIGTLIDFGLLVVCKELLGLPTVLANLVSFSAGTLNNFTLNRLWTYADVRNKRPLLQLAQFAAVSAAGLGLNTAIVLAGESALGSLSILPTYSYLIAKVLATGVVLIWNFGANRLWTFNDAQAGAHQAASLPR